MPCQYEGSTKLPFLYVIVYQILKLVMLGGLSRLVLSLGVFEYHDIILEMRVYTSLIVHIRPYFILFIYLMCYITR